MFAPLGNGLSTKVGHFYGLTNYESVMATKNFFYSHSMSFMWDGPFTHTGVLPTYQLDDNFEVTAGGVMGWNNVNAYMSVWNFLGKFAWTSDDKGTNASFAIIAGDQPNLDNLTRYTFRVEHKFLTDWEGVLQWTNGIPTERSGASGEGYLLVRYPELPVLQRHGRTVRRGARRMAARSGRHSFPLRRNDRPGSAPIGIGSSYYRSDPRGQIEPPQVGHGASRVPLRLGGQCQGLRCGQAP